MAATRVPAKPARKPKARTSTRRRVRDVLLALALGIVVLVGAGIAWLWPRCSGEGCPSVAALRTYTPPQATRVLDRNGVVLAHLAPERRIVVPLARVPATVAGAFLAVEDRRFFRHHGVDWRRAVGALVRDIKDMGFTQGFSTLTMQLARNVFPEHLSRAKTLPRKAWEIMLARQIEKEFSKQEILEMYLNQIYLGNGLYGVEAAAHGYFGRQATELTLAQAALLAAIPKAPSTYDPRRNPMAAIDRRNLVLSIMVDAGVATSEEAERAMAEPLGLVPPPEAQGDAPYFVAEVRRELRERFGADADQDGLKVFTGIDGAMQSAARDDLLAQLERVEAGDLGNFTGPKCGARGGEEPAGCLQGLFVAVDTRTGDVLALVGGRNFAASQFDRVTQAKRQPGSAFKPFVYATALAQGIPITTQLLGPGMQDAEGDYRPADHVADSVSVDLREGLKISSNRAAVALGERVGVQNVVRTAQSMGLSTPIPPYPSTFLGAAEVIPLEMVAAYTAFANGGIQVHPRLIRRVEDSGGRVLYQSEVERAAVLSPEVAFLSTSLMKDVIDHGTGYRVRESLPWAVPAAGKTGTTNESADAWFVGYTPDVAALAWMGFDQPKRIMRGADGGKLAAPVWGKVMAGYYKEHPVPADWQPPAGVISVAVDVGTGQLATDACPPDQVRNEWFVQGTEPATYCEIHQSGVGGWLRRRLRGIGDLLDGPAPVPAPTDTAVILPR
jgi:penicillin-binding protein 1A